MTPRKRPAETSAVGGGIVAVLAASLGADAGLVAAIAALSGVLPALVTFLATHGGVRGVARSVWSGR